ncbi:MAG: tetratricopeptide repeat protein [Verrucomicrobiota bacterium]
MASKAWAGLTWTPGEGWRVEGGLAAEVIGPTGEDFDNAIEIMDEARAEQEDGNQWSALGLYDDVVDDYPNSIFAPEALYQRGVIYISRNQFENATEEFAEIIRKYPNYENYNKVIAELYRIGELVQDGESPYYWGVIPGFYNHELAMTAYADVVVNAPYSDYAPLALMNMALTANDNDKPEEAIDALDRLINNYPDSIIASDAYLTLAQTYGNLVQGPEYDQGATRQSIAFYQDFLILYPDSANVPDAEAGLYYMEETLAGNKYDLGTFYWNYRNNPQAALIFLNEAITVAPNSPTAQKARELIVEIRSGAEPPMTPYDWVFGRYEEPSEREFLEQSQVDMLENEAFQIQETEDFLETPGAMAEEVIEPDGDVEQFEGVGLPLADPFLDDPIMEPYYGVDPIDPMIGPEFDVDNLFPVELPGPETQEQRAIDEQQEENAQNPDLPAGDI